MAPTSHEPLFRAPGKRAFREALDWIALSGALGILLNVWLPIGIEMKVVSPFLRSRPVTPSSNPATGSVSPYAGWNNNGKSSRPKERPGPRSSSASPLKNSLADWQARFTHVSAFGAKKAWDNKAVFLDARKPEDYAAGHVAGAINFYADEFDAWAPKVLPRLDPSAAYVVYCNGTSCDLSHHLADQLSQQGFKNLKVFFNGWSEWKKAGYPVKEGPDP